MNNDRLARMQKTTGLHLAMEAKQLLQQMAELEDSPAGMGYFYELHRKMAVGEPQLPGLKRIGTMCVQVPDEIIYAVGGVPLRLCNGSYAFEQIGADLLPAKSCPLIKATIGMLELNREYWLNTLSALVVPTTCDLKKKAAAMLEDLGYPIIRLEFPANKESELSRMYWQESVKQLAQDLAKCTGVKLTASRLRQAIEKLRQASELSRRLAALRAHEPPLLYGTDALLVTGSFFIDEIESWLSAAKKLIVELEERREQQLFVGNRRSLRFLLTGSPPIFPNLKVPLLIEQSGAVIVTDEVCSGSRLLHDSVAYDSKGLFDLVPAVADRYLKPCTCPCLTPNHDRQRRLQELARSSQVDGIIYQAFSGCLPYELEARPITQAMMALEIPTLYVETDYSQEDMGQLNTRIEAFSESIKTRKRQKAA